MYFSLFLHCCFHLTFSSCFLSSCFCSVFANQSESDSRSVKPASLDMTENPRFAKPKLQSSPPPSSSKPKWQVGSTFRLVRTSMPSPPGTFARSLNASRASRTRPNRPCVNLNRLFRFCSWPSCLIVALFARFQPSPYLRLLESQMQPAHKHSESQHTEVQSLYHSMDDRSGFQTPEAQFTCPTTERWSRHQAPEPQASYPSPEPRTNLQCLSVSAAQLLSLKHVLKSKEQPPVTSTSSETLMFSTPALGGMLQQLKILEDKTAQVNAARNSAHVPMLHGSLERKALWARR